LKKTLLLLLSFMLLYTLVLAGCTAADPLPNISVPEPIDERPPEEERREERILRLDEQNLGFPSVYTVSPRGRGYLLTSFLFDTLTWKDEKGIVPLLAERWEVSDDKKNWTFYLVKNATFSDGTPVTAEDVKFSYEYIQQHPHPWVSLDMVEKVEAVGEYMVEIKLTDIYAPFLTEITGNVPVMPRHIWQDVSDPHQFNTPEAVIGSGPFTLEQYDATAGTYVFAANPNYFLGAPVIDKLIFSEVSQPAQALANGDLDAAQRISYGEAMRMKEEGRFTVIEGPGFWVYRMYFNFDCPEFNEVSVRKAFYHAINRDEIVVKAAGSGAVPGNPGHIHPDSEWYFPGVKDYAFNPEKAGSLLDEADILDKNGDGIREFKGSPMKYELLVANDRVNEAEMVKSYLGDIGVALEIKAMDQQSVDSLLKEGTFDLALNGHGSFGGDPVLLARFASDKASLGSTPSVTAQGGGQWVDKEFNDLFSRQIREIDYEERYKQVARLQEIIAEELPTLTLYYRKITFAFNSETLNGWFFTKDGVAQAVPTVQNKLVYIRGTWGR
jgi:peptide/nickel transport system substrate-binding protein